MRLEQEALIEGTKTVPEQPEDRLDMALAGVIRDGEIGNRLPLCQHD